MTSFSVYFCSTLGPRHPRRRILWQLRVPEQFGQIVERIGSVQLTGVDQAHEQVAHPGAMQRLVEQRVLAVQDGFLESPLGDVMPPPGLCRVLFPSCRLSLGEISFWRARLSA